VNKCLVLSVVVVGKVVGLYLQSESWPVLHRAVIAVLTCELFFSLHLKILHCDVTSVHRLYTCTLQW